MREARRKARSRRHARSVAARRQARRRHGARARGYRALCPIRSARCSAEWTRPNGMVIQRLRVPLGRDRNHLREPPQCHRGRGRAVPEIRQCGHPARRLGERALERARSMRACEEGSTPRDLPRACIQLVPTTDRAAVGDMLADMADSIDVIVPRGGKSLIARVQKEARVPVIGHLEGVCHVYVDRGANLEMAQRDRAQRQDAPHRHLRLGGDSARGSRLRGDASGAADQDAARCRLRGARR